MPQSRWSTADLLDLEFFLHQDEGEDIALLATRDRELYAALPKQELADKELLHSWLACRKQSEEAALPSSFWRELIYIAFGAIVLTGLFSGVGLAFSVLTYSGVQPVNVAVYLAVFVILQIILFVLLASSFLCSRLQGHSFLTTSLLYKLAEQLWFRLLKKFMATAQPQTTLKISAKNRLNWIAQVNSLKNLQHRYGLLFVQPLFLLAQMFGISFNVGVLSATLLKVIGSDLAFGWQSTLQLDVAAIHAVVEWISLPWAWFAQSCVPSPAQIEGSRLILKDGIYHLANRDLASWWPFLCLSVCCYGLLPRLVLLTAGLLRQRRDVATLDFRQACFRQIIHRMRTPLVSTAATTKEQAMAAFQVDEKFFQAQPTASATSPIIALIPDELCAAFSFVALHEHIRCRTGYQLCQIMPFWALDTSEEEEINALLMLLNQQNCFDILIIQEAWQPPVQELLTWLALLRRSIGPQPVIVLALIGKPTVETLLTPTQPQHLRIWQQKMAAFSDPGLHLIELVHHAESHP